jgi:hypothetical protein
VRLIASSVLDRSALDREVCAQSHLTALKFHGASKLAMVARATRTSRADEACVRSQQVHSIALAGAKIPFCSIPSLLNHILHQGPTTH